MKEMSRDKKNILGLTSVVFGYSIFSSLPAMALPLFFTDVLFMAPATASLIFLIARVWDAVNDPIMGYIIDNTKTRWGKCRPYILFSSLPLLVGTILLFTPFSTSNGQAQFGIYLGAYLIFVTSVTALEIPLSGVKLLLFKSPDTRNKAISISQTFGTIGSFLAIDIFFIMVEFFGKGNEKVGYLITVILISVLGFITLLTGFMTVKEVVPTVRQKTNVISAFKRVLKNKYMVLIIVAGAFNVITRSFDMLLPYFAKWNLADMFSFGGFSVHAIMIPILSIGNGIIFMVSVFVAPWLLKYISKKKLILSMCAMMVVTNLIAQFVGYSNLFVFMGIRMLAHIPVSINGIVLLFMFADTLDYAEYKCGARTEGSSYALNNLIMQICNALFSSTVLVILGIVGYNALITVPSLDIGENIFFQYSHMLQGIFTMINILPLIGGILQAIPILFYDLNEDKYNKIVEQLNIRRAKIEEASYEA